MRRFMLSAALVVLAAVWTGSAAAAQPVRTVTFETTQEFTSPFCGDAVITEDDVGRITFTEFSGSDRFRLAIHDAAVTVTLTNTETGATLTAFYSNIEDARVTFDPATGIYSETVSFSGLNFIIRGAVAPPLVSAGRGVLSLRFTIDADGNPVLLDRAETSTPNLVHTTQVLCG